MKPAGILTNVFLVLGALTIAGAATLPFRRTSIFRDSETPRRHYEELIASRQIRSNDFGKRYRVLRSFFIDSFEVTVSFIDFAADDEIKTSSTVEPAGTLQFHVKPPSQMTVAMNDRLELLCDVSGSPPPAVYWLKNGMPIPESPFDREEVEESTNKILESESLLPTRGLASTKSRLVIDCVDGEAEAIYTCVAQSIKEKIVSSTYVHIEGEAPYNETTCMLRHETYSLPATVFMWSGTYIDLEGKGALLLCRAVGNPTPKVSWYIEDEDQPITTGAQYQVLPSGDLKIRHLRWSEHMGLFKCRAENEFGMDQSTTFVYPVVQES
ncbi:neural/ectodermal development factor IMP-L2-like [Daphnia carinata]|uniref:neural/ectodermal development factor IMP-L2-like n=1 Tax=Daphnia carinata TaxID=120202 RepID=UPI00257E61F2|nr:neural/ectodermal development factor IMP-L2-like [Daphnia carinata]